MAAATLDLERSTACDWGCKGGGSHRSPTQGTTRLAAAAVFRPIALSRQ
jgi:hypothetical protein